MGHKEQPEEQPDERIQTAVDIITEAPAEKRDTIINNMLAILLIFAPEYRQSVSIEEVLKNIDILKIYLSEENVIILMESVGYIQNKDTIDLNSTHMEIAGRIDYLYKHFKEDLIIFNMEKAISELDASLRIHNVVYTHHVMPAFINMPVNLMEKMKSINDGDLLVEGTILLSFGRTVFRLAGKGEKIEWQNHELFEKYQHGTFVRIYKKGMTVEVKEVGN